MQLDFQKDRRKLRKYVLLRVDEYPVYVNDGPGEDDALIELVTLGYSVDRGCFALVFDTRRDADIDGAWTLHRNEHTTMASFPNWTAVIDAFCDGKPIKLVVGNKRKSQVLDSEEAIAAAFGEFIRDMMIELRDEGALDSLPLSKNARLSVEEFEGHWEWPQGTDFRLRSDSANVKHSKSNRKLSKEALAKPIRNLSKEEQMRFWIDQLSKYARGKHSELGKLEEEPDADGFVYNGWVPDFALDELEKFGKRAVIPMLKMARTVARYPEWIGDRPAKKVKETPVQNVAIGAIWKVQEIGHAAPEAEKLLRQIFKAACKTNEDRKLWGILPFHTAVCLKTLFAGYPSPGIRGNNQPIEIEAFMRTPKKG